MINAEILIGNSFDVLNYLLKLNQNNWSKKLSRQILCKMTNLDSLVCKAFNCF